MKKIFLYVITILITSALFIPKDVSINVLTEEMKESASRKRQEALQSEIKCMSKALYYEAGNQPTEGIRAVYEVIRNRAVKKNTSWCFVISERKQFSFLNSGKISLKSELKPREKELYDNVKYLDNILSDDALFYHADYVKPTWSKRMIVEKKIGNHIFYKLKEKK